MSSQPVPPQQQRLEGPVLEELLTEVRERFGADATIVEANRLRRGGVAGFFTRERFEVVVEAPEGGPSGDDAPADEPKGPAVVSEATEVDASPASLLEWADAVSADESGEPRVSTEGERFAEVLARIARSTAEDEAAATDHSIAAFEPWSPAGLPAAPAGTVPTAPAADRPATGSDAPPAPVEPAAEATETTEPAAPVDPAAAFAARTASAVREGGPAAVAAALGGATPPPPAPVNPYAAMTGAPKAPAAPASVPATVAAPVAVELVAPAPVLDVAPLVRVGLPADLAAAGRTEADLPNALLRALEQLPRPAALPDLPGAVIAVVGERSAALALGARIAEELELSTESVLLASAKYRGRAIAEHRRIDTVASARERRLGWRRRQRPVVVAVETTTARGDCVWASRMLDTLEVAMTWGTVEASRKPEDVEAWAASLGGVDALALTDLDATVSPAAVLHTGLPVGFLDDEVATAGRWAAVLTDRIAA